MKSEYKLLSCLASLFFVFPFISTSAFAQRETGPVTDRITIDPVLTVTGRISFENCSPANPVTFSVSGLQSRQVTARMTPIGGEFATDWNYVITLPRLPYGTYNIRPQLAPGDCPGGTWSPATRRVSYTVSVQAARGMDFRYSVPLTRTLIPMAALTGVIESCMNGTRVRLNNHGPRHGNSWLLVNDSSVQLSDCLGGEEIRFTLPEYVMDGRIRPRVRNLYYINDLNLESIDAGTEGSSFRLTFQFEDAGTEIKGHCIKEELIGSGWKDCPIGSDKGTPDVQIQEMQVHILLEPTAYLGGITFGRVQARFEGRIRAGGGCTAFGIDVCELLGNYKRRIQQQIEQAFLNLINRGSTRSAVARTFRALLDARRIGHVRSARIEGTNLVITHSPGR